jgi:hypothetical protein
MLARCAVLLRSRWFDALAAVLLTLAAPLTMLVESAPAARRGQEALVVAKASAGERLPDRGLPPSPGPIDPTTPGE